MLAWYFVSMEVMAVLKDFKNYDLSQGNLISCKDGGPYRYGSICPRYNTKIIMKYLVILYSVNIVKMCRYCP